MKMKDCASTTWKKLLEIPTHAKTTRGKVAAVRRQTDFFNDFSDDEVTDFLKSEWATICEDGIIIWADEK